MARATRNWRVTRSLGEVGQPVEFIASLPVALGHGKVGEVGFEHRDRDRACTEGGHGDGKGLECMCRGGLSFWGGIRFS